MTKHQKYEIEKWKIAKTAKTADEYERLIAELIKKLKL